jgi:hypothetical protein
LKPDAFSDDDEDEKPRKKKVKKNNEDEWSDDDAKYLIKKPRSDMEKRRKFLLFIKESWSVPEIKKIKTKKMTKLNLFLKWI